MNSVSKKKIEEIDSLRFNEKICYDCAICGKKRNVVLYKFYKYGKKSNGCFHFWLCVNCFTDKKKDKKLEENKKWFAMY